MQADAHFPKPLSSSVFASLDELIALKNSVPAGSQMDITRLRTGKPSDSVSKATGRGLDFSEVREYQPGDDVRTIDWKVTARSGKLHTKVYEEEREQPFYVITDLRPAMFFGTRTAFKSVIAARLAAMLAWGGYARRDRVGGAVISDHGVSEIQPVSGTRGVMQLLHQIVDAQQRVLQKAPHEFAASIDESLDVLLRVSPQACASVWISDFNALHDRHASAIDRFVKSRQLVACRVLDVLETRLPSPSVYAITDGVQTNTIDTRSPATRAAFIDTYRAERARVVQLFFGPGRQYVECLTDADLARLTTGILRSLPGSH